MSKQERVSWISLFINLVVGWWYFSEVLAIPAEVDFHSRSMGALVTTVIMLTIVLTIAAEMVLRLVAGTPADKVAQDERDVLISAKAYRNAYGLLSSGVILVVVVIVWAQTRTAIHLSQQNDWYADPLRYLLVNIGNTSFIAHPLLLANLVAICVVYASRIFYYRRGY